ncbi:MAG: hypothetical protein ACYCWE_21060 [Eubacteriales bacterium]
MNKYRVIYPGSGSFDIEAKDKHGAVIAVSHQIKKPWTQIAREGIIQQIDTTSPRSEEGAIR